MNILIIEDDLIFAKHLINALERQNLVNRVSQIVSLKEFEMHLSDLQKYDIILLDLSLERDIPEQLSGLLILKRIRTYYHHIPVIIISAHEQIDLMEQALSLGANDYITKNIRLSEIKLRVFHWHRLYYLKSLHLQGKIYKYEGFQYHIDEGLFLYKNKKIELSKNNRYILSLFLMSPGEVLTEKLLTEKVWGDHTEANIRALRVSIGRLRKSLEEYGASTWIENIYSEGYVFQKPH